jgi:hypothetical protein
MLYGLKMTDTHNSLSVRNHVSFVIILATLWLVATPKYE